MVEGRENSEIMTFEKFIEVVDVEGFPAGRRRYGNFAIHWLGGLAGDTYRRTVYYKQFKEEHPELAGELESGILNRRKYDDNGRELGFYESIQPFEQEMYIAYLAMHGYGVGDKTLFS